MAYPPPGGAGYPPPGGAGYPPPGGAGYPPPGGAPQQRWQAGQGGPHQWDNTPQQPVVDNPNMAPQGPPPMPAGFGPQVQGYQNVGAFGQPMAPMPPPPPPAPPSGQPPPMEFQKVGNLNEEECREALKEYVAQHCCYGKKPAEDHMLKDIRSSTALHYTLETFCESRSTGYVHEPFMGQMIDGPENGIPPPPWAIPCNADQLFHDHTKLLEVPHTAVVKMCHHCDGRGFLRCHRCHGRGQVRCGTCGGDGRRSVYDAESQRHRQERCFSCGGDGLRSCMTCGGDGRITCGTCDGYRQLKCYIRLSVRFQNHVEDYILEQTDMPDELVRDVQGDLIFEQQLNQVWPIAHYPVPVVAQNSIRLVESHRTKFPSERSLQQRQRLRAVPVTEIEAEWDDWKSRYWVYGLERMVHCPDYPHTCCWGCNIL